MTQDGLHESWTSYGGFHLKCALHWVFHESTWNLARYLACLLSAWRYVEAFTKVHLCASLSKAGSTVPRSVPRAFQLGFLCWRLLCAALYRNDSCLKCIFCSSIAATVDRTMCFSTLKALSWTTQLFPRPQKFSQSCCSKTNLCEILLFGDEHNYHCLRWWKYSS